MSKYAIDVEEKTLDLIEVLCGVRFDTKDIGDDNVFLLEVNSNGTEAEITSKENLYDENGNSDPEIQWLIS